MNTYSSFFVSIILFIYARSSNSQGDDPFKTCAPYPFSCGNVNNLAYPFLAGDRPPFCGYTNMTLTCENESPKIVIGWEEYIVKNISYRERLLTIVRTDIWSSSCPRPSTETTITNDYEFTSPKEVLSIYYDCFNMSAHKDLIVIPCLGYLSYLSAKPKNSEIFKNCLQTIEVPAMEGAWDRLTRNESSYVEVLTEGFQVKWLMGAGWCTECVLSGGICGSNQSVLNQTICFCPDGARYASCSRGNSKVKKSVAIGVGCGVVGFLVANLAFLVPKYLWLRHQAASKALLSQNFSPDPSSEHDLEECPCVLYTHIFSYKELEEATNNFDSSRELGDGGFGTVYFGKLQDGRSVAVKRLHENSYKRVKQFVNEVKILSSLRHENLVTLYGCTSRHSRELLLVYEFIPNGTVADHLHGDHAQKGALTWPIRMNVAIETAESLAYLHAFEPPIIHRDVKTKNILLDSNLHVKVADFGLSRLFPIDVTHVSTTPKGTPGYVDPEYYKCFQLTDKSDVYSFGVVLMEIISSKPAVDITRQEISLANMAINKIHNGALHELIDLDLGFNTDYRVRKMITLVADLGFRCLQEEKDMRPSMDEVVEVLKGIVSDQAKLTSSSNSAAHEDSTSSMQEEPFGNNTCTKGVLSVVTTLRRQP